MVQAGGLFSGVGIVQRVQAGGLFSGVLVDELQAAWKTFGRLDLATESPAKRKAVGKLRDRLSDLMNELEGIR